MAWRFRLDGFQPAPAHERTGVNLYAIATTLIPVFLSFYTMAVLVQLPRTRLHRVSLFPVVLWMVLRANMSLDIPWNNPEYAHLNQFLALLGFIVVMRSAVWAIAQHPYARLPVQKSIYKTTHGGAPAQQGASLSSAMWNAWDLLANHRCIGWTTPNQRIRIPAPCFQVESRFIFVLLSLCQVFFLALVLDGLCGYLRSLGPDTFGMPEGGSIFDPSFPLPQVYMRSSVIVVLTGVIAYLAIQMSYQTHAVLFTILFWQYPWQWPPLFDYPWLSTSLASLWGRRWHQLLRECFMAIGNKHTEKYLGQTGTVILVFAVSGVLHGVGIRGMDPDTDTLPVVVFFLMQGVGVILEQAWKWITGRRVAGFFGWLWAFVWVFLWGHLIVETWARSGLLGPAFPEAYRPLPFLLNLIPR